MNFRIWFEALGEYLEVIMQLKRLKILVVLRQKALGELLKFSWNFWNSHVSGTSVEYVNPF